MLFQMKSQYMKNIDNPIEIEDINDIKGINVIPY